MYTFSHLRFSHRGRPIWRAWLCLGAGLILPSLATAAQVKKNPTSKIYVADVDGAGLLELCDTYVRIPMLGRKHSLNVATAGGVVIYELLRKYRRMLDNA